MPRNATPPNDPALLLDNQLCFALFQVFQFITKAHSDY